MEKNAGHGDVRCHCGRVVPHEKGFWYSVEVQKKLGFLFTTSAQDFIFLKKEALL